MTDTFKTGVARWLLTQQDRIVSINDVAASMSCNRDQAGAALLGLARDGLADNLAAVGKGAYQWTRAPRKGPARRLNQPEKELGAEMLAAGASEREVARALNAGPATAHRLKERLPPEPKAAPQPQLPFASGAILEIIGRTSDGTVLARHEDGTIGTWRPL